MANATASEQCPRCGQSDRVQTASGANLSAPPPPSGTLVKAFRIVQWVAIVIIALCLVLVLVIDLVTLGAAGSLIGVGTIFFMFLSQLIYIGLVGAVLIGVPWFLGRHFGRIYKQQVSQWQKATDKWNSLYYCTRCAGVFLHGQDRLVPIEQMRSFIYEIEPGQFPFGT